MDGRDAVNTTTLYRVGFSDPVQVSTEQSKKMLKTRRWSIRPANHALPQLDSEPSEKAVSDRPLAPTPTRVQTGSPQAPKNKV